FEGAASWWQLTRCLWERFRKSTIGSPKTLAFSLQGRKVSFEEAWAVFPASAHNFRPAALIRSESGVRSKRSMTFLPSKIPLIQAPMAGGSGTDARIPV